MCGIYFQQLLTYEGADHYNLKETLLDEYTSSQQNFSKISHRGPDNSIFLNDKQFSKNYACFWGFHRLAINGQTPESNQPFFIKNCRLICNGEIYNFRELIKEFQLEEEYKSQSDCEIIIHLYKKIGIKKTLDRLDGVFALVLHDYEKEITYIARDPVGVRSLFISTYGDGIVVASEMKAFYYSHNIIQFPPGCYAVYKNYKISSSDDVENVDESNIHFYSYYENLSICENLSSYMRGKGGSELIRIDRIYNYPIVEDTEENICKNIAKLFEEAVVKRLMSDRKVGALLSGGLDSSSVVAIMCRHMPAKDLNTYSIGLKGSTDLLWARKVADYLGTNHHEVCLEEHEFLDYIRDTIRQIESYDTTTVRASVPNYLISKYISGNTDDCVIYCGDMSDEIFGSYRGFMKALSEEEFKRENERMVRDVCYFDLLRSDKSISGAGLEARVPFADKKFLQYVMSIPPRYKMFDDKRIEKYIFRKAFDGLLPDDILWRRKEAFSDGVSGHERSWFQIIKDFVNKEVTDEEYDKYVNDYVSREKLPKSRFKKVCPPYDKESYYYRKCYENKNHNGLAFTDMYEVIPYFWRHPFCEEKDPSARLLTCYTNTDT
jgi:asparagine synthase (glutamine-hydrolysing)